MEIYDEDYIQIRRNVVVPALLAFSARLKS